MKKRLSFVMMLLMMFLPPLTAFGERMPDYYSLYEAAREAGDEAAMAQIRADMPQSLWPFYDAETGLYGYINFLGEWAIPPQFYSAGDFRGDYAAASLPQDDEEEGYSDGVIDKAGNWVVEPKYFVDGGYDGWYYGGMSLGYYQLWEYPADDGAEAKFGFFDVPSGYFSGIIYDDEISFWNGSRLVPVSLDGRECYVDRTNGSVAFFLPEGMYAELWSRVDSEFVDGFATVYRDIDSGEEKDMFDDPDEVIIINEQGGVLDLSAIDYYDTNGGGLFAHVFPGGLLVARDRETNLYGVYDLNALDWRVRPQYLYVYDYSSGYACVEIAENVFGHIDTQGNLLASGFSDWYEFLGDYACVEQEENSILINAAGETVLAFPEHLSLQSQVDGEMREGYDYYVSPDGLMEVYDRSVQGYGIMNLQGQWVLPPEENQHLYMGEEIYSPEGWRFFSEGLQAVERKKGVEGYRTVGAKKIPLYEWGIGYVDAEGRVVIDFQYDDAGAFLDGLAWVERDGLYGWVDAYGREMMMQTR